MRLALVIVLVLDAFQLSAAIPISTLSANASAMIPPNNDTFISVLNASSLLLSNDTLVGVFNASDVLAKNTVLMPKILIIEKTSFITEGTYTRYIAIFFLIFFFLCICFLLWHMLIEDLVLGPCLVAEPACSPQYCIQAYTAKKAFPSSSPPPGRPNASQAQQQNGQPKIPDPQQEAKSSSQKPSLREQCPTIGSSEQQTQIS